MKRINRKIRLYTVQSDLFLLYADAKYFTTFTKTSSPEKQSLHGKI